MSSEVSEELQSNFCIWWLSKADQTTIGIPRNLTQESKELKKKFRRDYIEKWLEFNKNGEHVFDTSKSIIPEYILSCLETIYEVSCSGMVFDSTSVSNYFPVSFFANMWQFITRRHWKYSLYSGIVMHRSDLLYVHAMGGCFTDLSLNLLDPVEELKHQMVELMDTKAGIDEQEWQQIKNMVMPPSEVEAILWQNPPAPEWINKESENKKKRDEQAEKDAFKKQSGQNKYHKLMTMEVRLMTLLGMDYVLDDTEDLIVERVSELLRKTRNNDHEQTWQA